MESGGWLGGGKKSRDGEWRLARRGKEWPPPQIL